MSLLRILRRGLIAIVVALPFLSGLVAVANAGQVNASFLGSVAIEGYDPVAYFTDGMPVEGSSDFTAEYNGAVWRFASAANRDAFAANPEAYAPQYGGYCAWAVSQGYTAPIDPEAWKIVDDKLYLNFNKSVQRRWAGDIPGNIAKGDANWPGIKDKL
jgi:YHS domain-containing protein